VHYLRLPEDLVEVSDQLHRDFINAPAGTRLTVSANGRVSMVPPEPPALDQLRLQKVRQLRADHTASALGLTFTTAGGTEAVFGNSSQDRENVEAALALGEKGWKPIGLWLDREGRPVTPFTFADLKGLSAAMQGHSPADHVELLGRIAKAMGAKTAADLDAI